MDFLLRLFDGLSSEGKLAVFLVLLAGSVVALASTVINYRQIRRLKKLLSRKEKEVKQWRREVEALQDRFHALNQVDEHVWKRPAHGVPRIALLDQRKTRFIAVCNLKGGVGKTTVTANVGTELALRGSRVWLIDLDFQGTLSNLLLDETSLKDYRVKDWTSAHLIRPESTTEGVLRYVFPSKHSSNCFVTLASDRLEMTDFAQQARFYVDGKNESRFHMLRLIHQPAVYERFDYVFFDCPPRMTTSCINALTCADFIIVPTGLSDMDIEAVRRTLTWLRELKPIIQGELLGVVVSKCRERTGGPMGFERGQIDNLKQYLKQGPWVNQAVFDAYIPDKPQIIRFVSERKPAVLDPVAKEWFRPLCDELVRRVRR